VAIAAAVVVGWRAWQRAPAVPKVAAAASSLPTGPSLGSDDDFVFGGRTTGWWSNSLTALRSARDPAATQRFQLVKQRAEALGLLVVETANAIKVQPSPELDRLIDQRLGHRKE